MYCYLQSTVNLMCPLHDLPFLSEAELRSSLLEFDRVKDSYLKTVKQVTLCEASMTVETEYY